MSVEGVSTVHSLKLLHRGAFGAIRIVRPEFALIAHAIDMPDGIVHSEFHERPEDVECHVVNHNVADVHEPVRVEVGVDTRPVCLHAHVTHFSETESREERLESCVEERRVEHS